MDWDRLYLLEEKVWTTIRKSSEEWSKGELQKDEPRLFVCDFEEEIVFLQLFLNGQEMGLPRSANKVL